MTKEERQSWRRADSEQRKARRLRGQARGPQFSISLQGPSSLSLSTLSFTFTATLHYRSDPSNTGRHVLLPSNHGPLHTDAIRSGYYSVYTSAECKSSDRVNYKRYGGCFRAPRLPDGRIITHVKYVISFENGYRELAPGEELSSEVLLDLSESSQWRELLHVGEVYWLRYEEDEGTAKAALGHVGLPPGWRYGKLSVGPMSPLLIYFWNGC